jgi:hypothetical protein
VGEAVDTNQARARADEDIGPSTESFLIQRYGTAIQILITNPREVTIDYMRRVIAREYARLRRDLPRRKWGERSGRKGLIEERNRWYRDQYRGLRQAPSRVAADRIMERVLDEGKTQFGRLGEISMERLKRIIYGH